MMLTYVGSDAGSVTRLLGIWEHVASRRTSWHGVTKAGLAQQNPAQFTLALGERLQAIPSASRRGAALGEPHATRSRQVARSIEHIRGRLGNWGASRRCGRARTLRGNLPEASDILLSVLQRLMCHGASNSDAPTCQITATQQLAVFWQHVPRIRAL
jgi:hypothetical protein